MNRIRRMPILAWLVLCSVMAALPSRATAGAAQSQQTHATPPATAAAAAPRAPQGIETFDAAWKIVNDTHFDPKFNGVDWAAVREELRPKAEAAGTTEEIRKIIRDMLARLGHSHMSLIPREVADDVAPAERDAGADRDVDAAAAAAVARAIELGCGDLKGIARRSGRVGFDVRLVDGVMMVTRVEADGPAARAGVRMGWILDAVGERKLAPVLAEIEKNLGARSMAMQAWGFTERILGGAPGTRVTLEFRDAADAAFPMTLERGCPAGTPVKFGNLPPLLVRFEKERRDASGGTQSVTAGVVRFNFWMTAVSPQFNAAVDEYREADGFIIDLRGNAGGVVGMVMGFAGQFIGERRPIGTIKMRHQENNLVAMPQLVNARAERVEPFAGPLAILVDGQSASASEVFAGGMQSVGRARVFGETSPGQVLGALMERLPNGDVLYHSFADFVTAKGTRLEGRGVEPDEPTPLRRDDLLAGHDPAMDAALRWIATEKAKRAR